MLFRAMFWITVVAVLMPREPDLGLGRPGAGDAATPAVRSAEALDCDHYEKACATAFSFLDSFQNVAVRGLADVKADIERDERLSLQRRTRSD